MRATVVGHVEWVEFLRVPEVPAAGAIVHASQTWQEPGGSGAVAAVQLARLAGGATLFTALGDDALGHRAHDELTARGVTVQVAWRARPQRRAVTFCDDHHERSIAVIGERLAPVGADPLPWEQLDGADCVYFTAGDAAALRAARAGRRLVATPRALPTLVEAAVELDALVGSGSDPGEHVPTGALQPPPRFQVETAGSDGGRWSAADGSEGRWDPAPLPGAPVDAYGCGDTFAAGVTYGLGDDRGIDGAVALGARCGAACLTGRGVHAVLTG